MELIITSVCIFSCVCVFMIYFIYLIGRIIDRRRKRKLSHLLFHCLRGSDAQEGAKMKPGFRASVRFPTYIRGAQRLHCLLLPYQAY